MATLETTFAGLKLRNPIIVSSSGLTDSAAKNQKLSEAGAGAIVLKSLFEEQIMMEADWLGDPNMYPEGSDYLVGYIREHKLGEYLNLIKESKKVCNIPIIASINCYQNADWVEFAAKIEEASVLLRMGKADQCIAVLDELLSKPLPRYMRLLALSIQADAWVTKEDTHSDTLRKAINLCTEILNTPNLGLAWKFKTLTQRAQFYERLNDQEKALDDYASILVHTPSGSSANKRRDWHWFYNAGFASIRLMGQAQNWDGALALARKLAQTSGPRAREAAAYARRIQLEHFIWQEDPVETEQPPEMQPVPKQAPQ